MPDGDRPILVGGETLIFETARASGGGQKYHPRTVDEARQILLPQAVSLRRETSDMSEELRGDHVVFQMTMLPNYIAMSYEPLELFELLDMVQLGSRPAFEVLQTGRRRPQRARTKSLVVAASNESLERLEDLISQPRSSRTVRAAAERLRQLTEIRLATESEVITASAQRDLEVTTGEIVTLEAVLHPDPDRSAVKRRPLGTRGWRKWVEFVDSLDGEVLSDHRVTSGALSFVPIRIETSRILDLYQFNPLRSVRAASRIRPLYPAEPMRGLRGRVRPPPPPSDDIPTVYTFDGGVSVPSPIYDDYVDSVAISEDPPDRQQVRHGEGVTTALLFDEVDPGSALPQPALKVRHFRCFPTNDVDETEMFWLLEKVSQTVESEEPYIVNLSAGPESSVSDGEPHPWTAKFDSIAYELGTLFVMAAGNNGEDDPATGLHRVQSPADMANGLSVGSCDRERRFTRTPYSAIGPGRSGSLIQPTGVAFGGSSGDPFIRVLGSGRLSPDMGTSYSSPTVARALTVLDERLGGADANTLRAFAVHFSEPPRPKALQAEMGYGRIPTDFDPLLECSAESFTLLYRGTLDRSSVVAHPLPWTATLSGKLRIRWTVVHTSPVEPSEPDEYTSVGIEQTFRPHSQTYSFSLAGQSQSVDTRDEALVSGLLNEGWQISLNPTSFAPPGGRTAAPEAALREAGKWETINNRNFPYLADRLHSPRLDLTYLARESGRASCPAELPYSLLVTVSSTEGLAIYDDLRAELSELPTYVEALGAIEL